MTRHRKPEENAISSTSFLDILANTIGALIFILILYVIISAELVKPTELELLTETLPDAIVDKEYSMTLALTGGIAPYHWSIINGSLPPGFRLDKDTGIIGGNTTKDGNVRFAVRVVDSKAAVDEKELNLTVRSSHVGLTFIYN